MEPKLSKHFFLEELQKEIWKSSNILVWGSIFFLIFISILDFLLLENFYIILTFFNVCTLFLIAISNFLLSKILKNPSPILHLTLVLLNFLFVYSIALVDNAIGYYLYFSLIALALVTFNSIAIWTFRNGIFQCIFLCVLIIVMDYYAIIDFSSLEEHGIYTVLAIAAISITFPSLKMLRLKDEILENYTLTQTKKEVERLNANLQKENNLKTQKITTYKNSAKVFRHDLKNKLGSIESLIELIELDNQYVLKPEQNDYLSMIKNLLGDASGENTFFNKFNDDHVEQAVLDKTMIDLHSLVSSNRVNLFEKTSAQNIKLELDLQAEKSMVYVDKNIANTAIYNLMNYAIRFSKNNDTIQVISRNYQDLIILELVNRTTGIPMSQLESYFRNIGDYQMDDGKSNQGLGLSIAKNNIELLDGHLRYSSSKSLGFEFLVEFTHSS
ncbi:putative two component sensor [Leeuwenhoekiella blandensis MED217]|uniref:Putative two component sensor n=2 Tax=Leeuwenhoekiella TaxID=283735 RepID=A3XKV0_LEEBM|nr:putative two component sensor [Leeuwenhoekiella blandensis MED217]